MGARFTRGLPLGAFAFVILALIALALAPAVLLNRISTAFDAVARTMLPTHDGLRMLALAMERQAVAVRGSMLTGDARYDAQFEEARAAEATTLAELGGLVPRISAAAAAHLRALEQLSARQYERNRAIMDEGEAVYDAALPQLDAIRDSVLLHLQGIDAELVRYTEQRVAEEARWATRQQTIAFALGAVAVLAALLVGWFGRQQLRLQAELELALTEANTSRAVAERRREELERVTESRARLMRGFGHDVKNPLGAADGYLQLLADGIVGPLSEQQMRSVERAQRSIAAGINLVDDLLELARAERGQLDVAFVPTDLRSVVSDAAEEYQAQAEAKQLTLQLRLPAAMPLVRTDGRRVRQVLGNLISNAVKYTSRGSVTVELKPDADAAGRVAIHVRDTGPGIPDVDRHLLFEEFVRLDPTTSRGAGIGLTISQRVAQVLGGEISVDSELGRGSTFTLWLPVQPVATPQPTGAAAD